MTESKPGAEQNDSSQHSVLSPQGVMAGRILRVVRGHPLLEPLREAGSIQVGGHARAVSARVVLKANDHLSAQIEEPNWWVPRGPNWAERLGHRLALSLREQWDARSAGQA